ncbi:MAG: hypothetical protein JWP38_3534 [Herbaspirillum sp.]|nr:hypothetical protein [Herbaspirillum sp.]
MSRFIATLVVSVAVLGAFAAQANAFGLSDVPGMGSKSSGSGSADLGAAQDQLVKQYVAGSKSVLLGNAGMADALGLKTQAAALRASGDSLSEGATKDNLADSAKVTSDGNKEMAAEMKNTGPLDAQAKQKYVAGMLLLAQGMGKYIGMKGSLDSFASGLKTVSPMMLPKLQSGAYIVTSLPSNMSNLGSALSNAVNFAKSQNIEIPADVTKSMNF